MGGTCNSSLDGAGANWVSFKAVQVNKDCTVAVTFRVDPAAPPAPGPAAAIPALGEWALALLALLLAAATVVRLRRR